VLVIGVPAASAIAGHGKTYVLQHGAWHGGWCWRIVADRLRGQGHRVFTPTQTGLGERRHLLSHDITLEVCVDDLANVFEAEELQDVILVGHSFGGPAVSGIADRMPGRIRHLVYLDALVLEDGQSAFSALRPEVAAARRKLAAEQTNGLAMPVPPVTAFGIPEDHVHAAWVGRRLTPHPVSAYESPLRLDNPIGNGRPCTYIHCTRPVYAATEASRQLAKRQASWQWQEIATAHDAMVTAPDELAEMLAAIE
jgi:pimeloyl-ACP methyl ester carboxylesterase